MHNSQIVDASELMDMLKEKTADSQSVWGRAHGISESHISQVLHGKRAIGPKIAKALGYGKKTVFTSLLSENDKS